MATMADVINRKYEQTPQFDFLFRTELPVLNIPTASDPFSVGTLGQYTTRALEAGLGGSNGILQTANEFLSSTTASNDMGPLDHRVYAVDAPFKTFDTRKAGTVKYFHTAGHVDVPSISLTVDEYEDGLTTQYFDDWMHKIKNNNGTYNPPNYYKRKLKVYRMSAAKLDLHVVEYIGVFPYDVNAINYSYDSNGILQLNVRLMVDEYHTSYVPEAVVKSMANQSDLNIIQNSNASHNKFQVGDLDGQIKSRAFDMVLDAVGL